MLIQLIKWSLGNRTLVLALSLLTLGLGIHAGLKLPVEVLPDLTKPTVTLLTEAPGLAPEEVEANITQVLENALTGIPGLDRIRSNSDIGLSAIYAEFSWGTDIREARLLVSERLQAARENLPENAAPYMTPVSSLMGEILLIGLRSKLPPETQGGLSQSELRLIADWTIRPQLQALTGVAEVLSMGAGVRQLELRPDLQKLQAHRVSLAELETAARNATGNETGGFLDKGATEIMVRSLAMSIDPEQIGKTLVAYREGRAVLISDVAQVAWGQAPLRGDAGVSVAPATRPGSGVILSVTKAPGVDTRELSGRIRKCLHELSPGLPGGMETVFLFQQQDFIDRAMENLSEAIRDGALMVALVLALFLMQVRTTAITLTAMPLSFATTLLSFQALGVSVNSMTLGGLAVAIGMVVDDAIVDVENVHRRLVANQQLISPRPVDQVILRASSEVRGSILYATILIILVFSPLLGLGGVEGRLFAPVATATMVSMGASFLVSMTLIPVLCSLLLRKPGKAHDSALGRLLRRILENWVLKPVLRFPLYVLGLVLLAAVGVSLLYPGMKRSFLPSFREETALLAISSAPGTSLVEMQRLCDAVESQLLQVPEVRKLGRRIGRAEQGDHIVPVSSAEFDIDFADPREVPSARPRKEVLTELLTRARKVPGVFAAVSGPMADRIGHMLSGVSAPVAIKIFGPDLDVLGRVAQQVQDLTAKVPGLGRATMDPQARIPQLRIEPRRDRAIAHGVTPGQINEHVSTLIGGRKIAELREGKRVFPFVIRLAEELRDAPGAVSQLPFQTGGGLWVPLSAVADIQEARGPNLILRENGQRRLVLALRPQEGDVGLLVDELKRRIHSETALPEGTFINIEGEFKAREEASARITVLSVCALGLILVLLWRHFRSFMLALQVLCSIPLALMGGLVLTKMLLAEISLASIVGFIAVAGIAARNGIMMVSHYLHLMREEGEGWGESLVIRGTLERMSPVLMTALAAGIALVPLLRAADQPGKELLHPVAVVIVGGLVSSTLLEFVIRPVLFLKFGRAAALRSLERARRS